MAAVMNNSHREKVRLPSISALTSLQPLRESTTSQSRNDNLPALSRITGLPPSPVSQGPAKVSPQPSDPLITLRAAADIFANENHLPSRNTFPPPETLNNPQSASTTPGKLTAKSPSTSPKQQLVPTPILNPMPTFTAQPIYQAQSFAPPHPYPPVFYNSYTTVPSVQHVDTSAPRRQPKQYHQQRQPLSRMKVRSTQACQRCGITETPEWRKGPNGARTLCNACGLFHAKVLKREGPEAAAYVIMSTSSRRRQPSQRRGHTPTSQAPQQVQPQHSQPLPPHPAQHIQMIPMTGPMIPQNSPPMMVQQHWQPQYHLQHPQPPGTTIQYMPGPPPPHLQGYPQQGPPLCGLPPNQSGRG